MVNLQDLPLEVLLEILSFIPTTDDLYEDDADRAIGTDVLYNTCLVSRKFRDLAQPLLFRDFTGRGMHKKRDINRDKTICFTKAIYARPDLGEHKHNIEFYTGIIKDLQLGDMEKDWIRAMYSKQLGLLMALLVNKTPNLHSLHMPVGGTVFELFPVFFSRDPSFLSNLTSVAIGTTFPSTGSDMKYYQELLSLPNLRDASIDSSALLDMSFPSSWTPGTLSANTFSFHGSHWEAGALRKFMRACKSLECFFFSPPRPYKSTGAPGFNAAQATEEALRHKDTLKVFQVEFSADNENLEEYSSTLVKYGSFAGFSVLQDLRVSHAYLPAHPQLPATLQRLSISNCNSSIRDMAQNIATDCKKGLYPHLTRVSVSALDITAPIKFPGQRIPEGQTAEQCLLSLQDMFKGTEVEFSISPLPPQYEDDEDYGDYYVFDDYLTPNDIYHARGISSRAFDAYFIEEMSL
ncbi:uncharacterized protein N7515_007782 [Penicillium bovifimosum]|uniref:F-box domain-containing protein n=1 Tax=Penicillium bovifimosum TaxID=126998 RepID=A0A9W9KWW4_9EURO|nr:uncharacterized protein N7515_007782 [Penicillium bovifimosum]KAJ5123957.1 hypothetical protein N7515_007782 [Penicillium bovifimosum]